VADLLNGREYSDTFSMQLLNLEVGSMTEIQYISDESGEPIGVIVPIELWREIESERETAYLLKSENMKRRLLEAKERQDGLSLEEAREKLGI
jgi:PHD/YefM family antitoxin component YafN of YafNO toxin-antitoxin module